MSSKDTHDERDLGYDGLNRRNILLAGSTLAAASALSSSAMFLCAPIRWACNG